MLRKLLESSIGNQDDQAYRAMLRKYKREPEVKNLVESMDDDYFRPIILSLYTYHDPAKPITGKQFAQYGITHEYFNRNYMLQKIRMAHVALFLKSRIPNGHQCTILDVGDNHGFFMDYLGATGKSININEKAVECLAGHGRNAAVGDAAQLAVPEKSYDYVFSFECIEHLQNPIRALEHFGQIARKGVFISIPFVVRTRIPNPQAHEGVRRAENIHVFEFCKKDFSAIAYRAGLEVVAVKDIHLYKPFPLIHCQRYMKRLLRPTWSVFELKKIKIREPS